MITTANNEKKKLQVTTPSDREIAMTRVFNAPRSMVFEAWTKPELIKRWLGVFGGWKWVVCEVDLRVGGAYRYVWQSANGEKLAMGGVYREIVRPERIVPPRNSTSSGTAATRWTRRSSLKNGQTTMTTTVLYESKEVRDGVLKSPMEGGVAKSYDKLEELLAALTE